MRFDSDGVDVSRVSDRRGRGGGGAIAAGGGLGIVGIIVVILFNLLSGGGAGIDPSLIQVPAGADPGQEPGETLQELEARCDGDGAVTQYTDCRLIKVVNVADDTWSKEFARRNLDFRPPGLAFFTDQTQTGGCGTASAQVGPFYCPGDETIYFELGFLDVLQQQFGAQGEFAQAYIAAHEYGHHLQTVLGTEREVRAAQQQNPDRANDYSIAMELQADCYAGVWSTLADANEGAGIVLTKDDVAEAIRAAEAVGDDRIQAKTQGQVNPETWTHGSAEQRAKWFETGLDSGDIAQCDTFGGLL
jgi:hypothetical protein